MSTNQSATSNLICKLLVILTALLAYDQSYIFGLISHTDILCLSACCYILRKAICNDNLLWKEIYRYKFLFDVQYAEEYDFVS
jgi:hypothetical protein